MSVKQDTDLKANGHGPLMPADAEREAREARIRYQDGDFQVTSPGAFVRCAVTGESIPLDELKYWSVARQEAYVDAAASLKRHQQTAEDSARS